MAIDQSLNLYGSRSRTKKARRKLTMGTRGNVGSIAGGSAGMLVLLSARRAADFV
jgi:hypothetical protein